MPAVGKVEPDFELGMQGELLQYGLRLAANSQHAQAGEAVALSYYE
jgi:hypothetical protein